MGLAFYCQYYNIAHHLPNTIPTAACVECQRPTEVHCVQCAAPLCIKSNGDANIFINCYITFHTPPKGKNIKLPNFLPDQNDSDSSETDQDISQKNVILKIYIRMLITCVLHPQVKQVVIMICKQTVVNKFKKPRNHLIN